MSDQVLSYATMHIYLKRTHGDPSEQMCACGMRADEWAYDHADPDEIIDERRERPYSLKAEHYKAMCRSCHRTMDRGGACKYGHPWTAETTYRFRTYRLCRKCRTEYMRSYRAKEKS